MIQHGLAKQPSGRATYGVVGHGRCCGEETPYSAVGAPLTIAGRRAARYFTRPNPNAVRAGVFSGALP